MAPLIEVNDEVLKTLNPKVYTLRNNLKNNSKSLDGFEYVPSLKLYISKKKKFFGDNWSESHKKLQANGERMPTPIEFIEFLKYTKTNLPEIYNDITKLGNPWRAEWIDAEFKVKNKELYINLEILDKDTLMKDKQISLEDYLNNNHTSQGLPSKTVKSGDLCYFYPRSDNNSVARFVAGSNGAYFYCDRNTWGSNLGVRAVRHA